MADTTKPGFYWWHKFEKRFVKAKYAHAVIIPGWEAFEFFVLTNHDFAYPYRVVDTRTGICVSSSSDSQTAAINQAQAGLKTITHREYKRRINQIVKEGQITLRVAAKRREGVEVR